jgi:putative ABC transport system permease protein
MGLSLTLARRGLLSRPGRTLFSVLGIALGVATVVGVIVLDFNTIVGLSGPAAERTTPDIQLRLPAGQAERDELYQVEGVSLMARYFQNDAAVRSEPISSDAPDSSEHREWARLIALEAQHAPALGVYSLAAGRDLAADGSREVLIGEGVAERFELQLGDDLWVARPRRPSKFVCEDGKLVKKRISADVPTPWKYEVVGILTREQIGRRSGGMVVVVDYANGQEIYAGVHVQPLIWANRDHSVDAERLKANIASSYAFVVSEAAILGQAADERAFRTGVRMAGLLALVLGMYVIFHTLSMSLTERMKEVGTLHTLGTTHGQIGGVFLLEAMSLAGVGAALGVLGGIGLAKGLLSAGITTLGTGKHINVFLIPWKMVLPLAGIGVLIALLGSIYPLFALRGTNTVAVLRGDQAPFKKRSSFGFHLLYALLLAVVLPSLFFVVVPVVGELTAELLSTLLGALGILSLVVILSLIMPAVLAGVCAAITAPFTRLWPLAGRITAKAMRAAPARIGVSTSALALVTAGLVGLKGMTASLEGEVDQWGTEAVLEKVWVSGMPPTVFADFAQHLHQYKGVVGLEKGGTGVHTPFLVQGVAVSELAGYGPCATDKSLLKKLDEQQGMIVSRRLAMDLGYELGTTVPLERADGQLEEFTVIAISDAYGHYPFPDERMYGLIADHYLERFYCHPTDTVEHVAVRLEKGSDPGILEAAVFDFHGGPQDIVFRSGAQVLQAHRDDIGRDFVLFDVLLILTACLAGLGVLNGQLLAALERSKELGVLKALGTSRGQLAGLVLLEALVVGFVGGVIGVALGWGLTPLVVEALRRLVGLDLPHVGPGNWIWLGLLGSVVVALVSALYPVWRTTRVDAVRAVRTG